MPESQGETDLIITFASRNQGYNGKGSFQCPDSQHITPRNAPRGKEIHHITGILPRVKSYSQQESHR